MAENNLSPEVASDSGNAPDQMDEFPTPHTGIRGSYKGFELDQKGSGMHSYLLRNSDSGAEEIVKSAYPLEDTERAGKRRPGFRSLMGAEFGSEAGQSLGKTLASSFDNLRYKDQRGLWKRALEPVFRSIPAFGVGGPWDIIGLFSYVPPPDELLMMGYNAVTGDDIRYGRRERREAGRKEIEEFYGIEATRRRFQQNLRAADDYAEDHWNFRPFEASVGTDMTPEARGVWEKMVTQGLEFAVSGPIMIKGVTYPAKLLQDGARFIFSKMAKDSARELGEGALKPENVRSLIDKANDAYSLFTKPGRRNITAEATYGGAAGVMTEGALATLEDTDPDAAGWVKMAAAIGVGLAGPLAVRSAYTGFLQAPLVNLATKAVIDPLFRPGHAAGRFTQREGMGTSAADRAGIASVARLLEEAIKDGKHVKEASGLAFTTPELARSESNILRAQLEIKRRRLGQETDPDIKARLEKEVEVDESNIGYLNRFANFQEGVLISASRDKSPAVVSRFFADEAERLVQRREQFFNYIEGTFKRAYDDIDFGGKPGGTPDEHALDYRNATSQGGYTPEFEATRRKLVMEGDPKGVEASEFAWLDPQTKTRTEGIQQDLTAQMEQVLADAQASAQKRVDFWNQQVDESLRTRGLTRSTMPEAERKLVGDIIRGTYDDAHREFRAFEKAAYGRVKGLDDAVTNDIVFPKGSIDPRDGSGISGMTVEAWASERLGNLSRTERFNLKEVPVQLAQLAGMRSVIAHLNRQRAEAVESGRAGAAQSRIPDLEQKRNDLIARKTEAEKELDNLRDRERTDAETQTRSLQSYVDDATAELDDVQRRAVVEFATRPTDWQNMSATGARAAAPKDLGAIFVEIARQNKALLKLGEGTKSSVAVNKQLDRVSELAEKAQKKQDEIDKITGEFLGTADDVIVEPTGRLTSRDANGDLVDVGVSANDVKETISDIAEAAWREKKTNGNSPKYRRLIQLRTTLEQLLTPETFPTLDAAQLAFAKEASRMKHRVDDAQGDILAKDGGSGAKVRVEEAGEKVLPETTGRAASAANLRELRESAADLPSFVTIKRGDDGKIVTDAEGIPVAVLDETALDGTSLFDLPESPFELVRSGEGGGFSEIRLKPDAPVGPRSLKLAENILLERLALQFSDGVDSKTLATFRENNREALNFLEVNGRSVVPKMLDDADDLANQLDILKTLRRKEAGNQITELVNNNQLDLQGLSVDDYLDYIGQRRRRISEDNNFAEVIKADPGYATKGLFDRVLNSSNNQPKTALNEFLSLVRGNRQAEKGLQASIIGELFRRSTTKPLASNEALIKQTGDRGATAFDPAEFRNLMANPRIRMMLQEAFPDNPALLDGLDEVARVAFETSTFTRGSARMTAAIDPQSALSTEAWSNLGRILGLWTAARVGFVNALVAAGAGARFTTKLGKNVTGNKIKDILIEAALDPEEAVKLARKTSDLGDGFFKTLAQGAIDIVASPYTVPTRRPAATAPVLIRSEEELDEETRIGPQSSIRPALGSRSLASRMPGGPPVDGSMLAQARPLDRQQFAAATPPGLDRQQFAAATPPGLDRQQFAAATPQGAPPQERREVLQGMADMGMPLFANKGGLASLQRKPRQMVH